MNKTEIIDMLNEFEARLAAREAEKKNIEAKMLNIPWEDVKGAIIENMKEIGADTAYLRENSFGNDGELIEQEELLFEINGELMGAHLLKLVDDRLFLTYSAAEKYVLEEDGEDIYFDYIYDDDNDETLAKETEVDSRIIRKVLMKILPLLLKDKRMYKRPNI